MVPRKSKQRRVWCGCAGRVGREARAGKEKENAPGTRGRQTAKRHSQVLGLPCSIRGPALARHQTGAAGLA